MFCAFFSSISYYLNAVTFIFSSIAVIEIVGSYRILIICMHFKVYLCDTYMLYFLVVAKFFVMMLRVCTSNSALVFCCNVYLHKSFASL